MFDNSLIQTVAFILLIALITSLGSFFFLYVGVLLFQEISYRKRMKSLKKAEEEQREEEKRRRFMGI